MGSLLNALKRYLPGTRTAPVAFDADAFADLQPARCYPEINWKTRRIEGWILLPDEGLQSVQVYVNGAPAGASALKPRPDVAAEYSRIPHAARSGFQVPVTANQFSTNQVNHVSVIGYQGSRPRARRDTLLFHPRLISEVPIPPPELIDKTQGGRDTELYKTLGFRYCQQLREIIGRHRALPSVRSVLDFACGSGRVAANFLADPKGPRVCGCDVDPEAVAFCQESLGQKGDRTSQTRVLSPFCPLRPGEFTEIQPLPPLTYPDAAFDVIYALAVFPAFGPDEQAVWLEELRRMLAPGGLLLVSIQGWFCASFLYPADTLREFLRDGIFHDQSQWHVEDRVIEEMYSRGIVQTRDYTRREWSRYFEVLEYLEGEINADQDLVVLRRPAYYPGR